MYEIRTLSKEELEYFTADMNKKKDSEIFEGFHFFKNDYSNYNQIYFVIIFKNTIVGIAKLGNSGNYGKDTWYINYIDIHSNFKRKGLSKELFIQINNWAKEKKSPICIFAGIEEHEGKESNISEVARKYISDIPYCANYEELSQYKKNNSHP